MSLSMGFILIWISMMASVLVSNTFKDNVSAKQTLHVFQTHKQMARIVFSIGHEMVSTVDWLVSIESKPRSRSLTIEEAIGITWKMTDSVISDVRRVCNDEELPKLLTLIEFKLSKIRSNEVFVGQNPLKIIKSYDTLFEAIERKSFSLDFASNPSTVRPDIQTSITYPLFIKGMAKRFSELSLGTVFVRSDITINKSDYYYYHFISKHLIDSAFQLNPRVQNRYFELQDSDGTSEVLVTLMDDNLNRRDNHLANLYLNSVKNEIAILLRARDFLNTSVSAQVTQSVTLNDRVLAFHMTIAVIAVFAVILSLTLLCSAFGYKQNKNVLKTDTNGERNDNTVYSIEFDDKVQIFGTNSSK
ncbi:unnamed protein product [Medioppia subpectinata]|uniref:Uncharacterized protein n=1 Tax=Medioppia subpectinata TaxID=1979941 RepID=A0A7R9KG40_9ACAR|nr:unnamed protein product [Medioppia subpectinata]CAG2102722.1 unnamed protein product [Medioppia subpectinata]